MELTKERLVELFKWLGFKHVTADVITDTHNGWHVDADGIRYANWLSDTMDKFMEALAAKCSFCLFNTYTGGGKIIKIEFYTVDGDFVYVIDDEDFQPYEYFMSKSHTVRHNEFHSIILCCLEFLEFYKEVEKEE